MNSIRHLAAALGCLLFPAAPALAHEKWYFQGNRPPLHPGDIGEPLTLVLLALVVALTLAALWVRRRWPGCNLLPHWSDFGATDDRKAVFYALIPAILGVHLAVTTLVNGASGDLFSPNNPLAGQWRYILGVLQTGIAIALFYGALTRLAAAMLAAIWCLSPLFIGLEAALENAHFLGFALFFWFAGRGPLAADRLIFPRLEPRAELLPRAMPALRICLGFSLIVVACTEKLMNLALVEAFLKQHPLNFTPYLGIAMSDRAFATCAGCVEFLVGLWILLGLYPRLIVLAAWLPFNITLTVFDTVELVGHLPYYGFMAVYLVYDGSAKTRPLWTRALRREIIPLAADA